jgi:hypothetical protein
MNQKPKTEKKPTAKDKIQIRDLEAKKDVKGGAVDSFIYFPPPPPPPPTKK